jgi:hypothetical protein
MEQSFPQVPQELLLKTLFLFSGTKFRQSPAISPLRLVSDYIQSLPSSETRGTELPGQTWETAVDKERQMQRVREDF